MTRRRSPSHPDTSPRKRRAVGSGDEPTEFPNLFSRLSAQCRDLRQNADDPNATLKTLTNGRPPPLAVLSLEGESTAPTLLTSQNRNKAVTITRPTEISAEQAARQTIVASRSQPEGPAVLSHLTSSIAPRNGSASTHGPDVTKTPQDRRPFSSPSFSSSGQFCLSNVSPPLQNDDISAERVEAIRKKLAENKASGITQKLSQAVTKETIPQKHPRSWIPPQFTEAVQRITFDPSAGTPTPYSSSVGFRTLPRAPDISHNAPSRTILRSASPLRPASFSDIDFQKASRRITFEPNVFPHSYCPQSRASRTTSRSPTPSTDLISQLQASVKAYPILQSDDQDHETGVHGAPTSPPPAPHIQAQANNAANWMATRPSYGYHKIKLKYWNSIPSLPDGVSSPLPMYGAPNQSRSPPVNTSSAKLSSSSECRHSAGSGLSSEKVVSIARRGWKPGRFKNLTQKRFQKYNAAGKLVGADRAIYGEEDVMSRHRGSKPLNNRVRVRHDVQSESDSPSVNDNRDIGEILHSPAAEIQPLSSEPAPLETDTSVDPQHQSTHQSISTPASDASSKSISGSRSRSESCHSSRLGTEEREVRKAMEELERDELLSSSPDPDDEVRYGS
ncbi:MAG: hypothetical protein Q9227_004163 [Pyrenula ochraceoflavens]